jgi:hypothetical protein
MPDIIIPDFCADCYRLSSALFAEEVQHPVKGIGPDYLGRRIDFKYQYLHYSLEQFST